MSSRPPILRNKEYKCPSLFLPDNLLREARRQKNIQDVDIPSVCILDPDGDIIRNLTATGQATLNTSWACYHTLLYNFIYNGIKFGVVGYTVGASFAVLVAEELFASGCRLLFSVTSAGRINQTVETPFFILITRALRDEGTSYHYLPPSDYSAINDDLLEKIGNTFSVPGVPVFLGATWTTDAPFRETERGIEYADSENIMAVEMEAAALYAFAQARHKPVICLAHVTNQMGVVEGDFEKGEEDGYKEVLDLIATVIKMLKDSPVKHEKTNLSRL